MRRKIKLALPLILIGCLIAAAALLIIKEEETRNTKIKVSGNIESRQVRLSFRAPGKIKELLTDEGRQVKTGDVLAKLDTDELLQIKNQAEASLKAAQSQYTLDKIEYDRAENLFQSGSISEQKRDSSKTKADSDKAEVQAQDASLELAKTRLGFAELTSPIDGFVLVKSAEASEFTQAGSTIFTVSELKDTWLTAYINETDLGKVKLNQRAEIKTDTYPDKIYTGTVTFISQEAEFTPKQIQTTEERVKLVYRIKITVDNRSLELKPGMPADGYIIEQ